MVSIPTQRICRSPAIRKKNSTTAGTVDKKYFIQQGRKNMKILNRSKWESAIISVEPERPKRLRTRHLNDSYDLCITAANNHHLKSRLSISLCWYIRWYSPRGKEIEILNKYMIGRKFPVWIFPIRAVSAWTCDLCWRCWFLYVLYN